MSAASKLSAANIKTIEQLVEQAKALPELLLKTLHASGDPLIDSLINCQCAAEDIDRALSTIQQELADAYYQNLAA